LYLDFEVNFAWETAELSAIQQLMRGSSHDSRPCKSGIFLHQNGISYQYLDDNSPPSHKIVNKYRNSKPAQSFTLLLPECIHRKKHQK